ncbi:MAG TPA: UDP-N-acetylmuramoyl-tripeptide--D-alanyl-D-alanine ligase [Chitinophagaceae bacterium]|nr:UDP-N-acetylmuramoyl-tripeptide--D-alanyl-D-alanine ligase [Chitinophagaceae bacterium]MCC6635986.1 UDP-N-acetylmuramoyl-tripeptide--D-alanyl-D-alanine ligase [Chitinophagaceae bacterium]HMZ46536.1 UDP-N-acetylmuramoyl-tripeptide--D-alanyl-D-alanine ligase [Chitinophagaceae bacterium]HNE92544.1 UDP-N-acetylmuramoyl-tripeptide--D-alanyl-D-alanine ligase [Chitinophagaceae bacterium]HNF29382.1 UDP-N-acetylmuramoyl-tripeptide--D-alanyl-D-alanine ligase [Chitinophagaceae bacterium]
MKIEELYHIYCNHSIICTDTRKIESNCIFFALKGENFNGNQFALEALNNGAAFVVVDEQVGISNDKIILVENVLYTLQQLAKYHRQQFTIPFIAITGSNGKTTTKELVSAVLKTQYTTYTTQGNLNNHIGVPLTILSIKKDAEMAVIEMGANHQKEIESYCLYTLPTHGIITNCGKAHLEGFGGEEGIKKGKGELFSFLKEHNGTAFVYNEYDYLLEMAMGIKEIVEYGSSSTLFSASIVQFDPYLSIKFSTNVTTEICTNLVGKYNFSNVLTAVAIGLYFNISMDKIKNAIVQYKPSNSRSQLLKIESNYFILDAYNANPSSMKVALENFAAIKADNKVVMLGAMMELGIDSIKEHQQIADLLLQLKFKNVVLTGGDFKFTHHPFIYKENNEAAKLWLQQNKFTNTYFLIKGSRSMQMEKIL